MIKKKISIKALEVDTRFFEGKLLKNENNVWGNSRCNCGSSFREMREQFAATDLRLLYSPTLYLLVFFPQCPNLFFVFCFIQNSTAIHVKNVYEHAETRHKQLGTYVSPLEGLKISYRTRNVVWGKNREKKVGRGLLFWKGALCIEWAGFPFVFQWNQTRVITVWIYTPVESQFSSLNDVVPKLVSRDLTTKPPLDPDRYFVLLYIIFSNRWKCTEIFKRVTFFLIYGDNYWLIDIYNRIKIRRVLKIEILKKLPDNFDLQCHST